DHPAPPLLPYTTLFRSVVGAPVATGDGVRAERQGRTDSSRGGGFRCRRGVFDELERRAAQDRGLDAGDPRYRRRDGGDGNGCSRSEEHTSELQSRFDLV